MRSALTATAAPRSDEPAVEGDHRVALRTAAPAEAPVWTNSGKSRSTSSTPLPRAPVERLRESAQPLNRAISSCREGSSTAGAAARSSARRTSARRHDTREHRSLRRPRSPRLRSRDEAPRWRHEPPVLDAPASGGSGPSPPPRGRTPPAGRPVRGARHPVSAPRPGPQRGESAEIPSSRSAVRPSRADRERRLLQLELAVGAADLLELDDQGLLRLVDLDDVGGDGVAPSLRLVPAAPQQDHGGADHERQHRGRRARL